MLPSHHVSEFCGGFVHGSYVPFTRYKNGKIRITIWLLFVRLNGTLIRKVKSDTMICEANARESAISRKLLGIVAFVIIIHSWSNRDELYTFEEREPV